ncbi:MAG: DUF951 domain-containing protein [Clostridia bacterium]|nr:DUF951 domain-containing protein [Oscillospiraceae bacterium]MBQ2773733.1 DUF951 domain-containing protein [Clostridia bacterium]MBQ3056805.1 DUF951 domain-containing protein [Clostridia bacterium]MBR2312537.1 DUF951 domain-containing protein [Clostridia bacterium]
MQIIKLFPNMIIELKKPHPCGRKDFKILRVGSVCRVVCLGCGRDMDIDRLKLEKSIKKTNPPQE